MAEYIGREAAMDAIQKAFSDQECDCEVMPDVFGALQEIPAADVAPVVHETPMLRYRPKRHEIYDEYGLNENGEMLYVKRTILDEKNYAMYCPACGKRLCSRFKNFCPNCGAKMDGGKA